MRILIAGGRGFLGGALAAELKSSGHEVMLLTRRAHPEPGSISWDGTGRGAWTAALASSDAIVNACGYGLEHWPWTNSTKRRFVSSRVEPGRALAEAMAATSPRPKVFVQFSGINRYGLSGAGIADESSPAGTDFLAQLTVHWESATEPLERLGVRRVVVRNAIVLDPHRGLFPLMSLPAKLFVGGRFGPGKQVVPWIHVADHVRALECLLEDEQASGPYNLVAPTVTTNAEFVRAVCRALKRPYWLHIPAFALRLALGEMGVLVLAGRASRPRRLLESGFQFFFPTVELAVQDIFGG